MESAVCVVSAMDDGKCKSNVICNSLCSARVNVVSGGDLWCE